MQSSQKAPKKTMKDFFSLQPKTTQEASSSSQGQSTTTQTNSHKKASNPFSTGGGGTFFEQKIQAYFVAFYLSEAVFPIFNKSDCNKIVLQGRRHGFQTDDLVIYFQDQNQGESKLLMQVKHKLTFTEGDKQSNEAIMQAWHDFHSGDPAIFNAETDKVAFVVGQLSQNLIDHLLPLLQWARSSKDENDFMNRFLQNATKKKEQLDILKAIIKKDIQRDPTNLELWEFLKVVDVLCYDLDSDHGRDLSQVLTMIKGQLIEQTDANVQAVWDQLCNVVAQHNQNSGTLTRETLPKSLIRKFNKRVQIASSWRFPPFDAENFIGNQPYLAEIKKRCETQNSDSVLIPVVGLGGLGKTYLIQKACMDLSKKYARLVWFNARNIKLLEEQFIEFAKEHGISFEEELSLEIKIEKVKGWFAKNPFTLMVLDDAENYGTISRFIPSHNVHVLITSINTIDWNHAIQLNPMELQDAVQLLQREADLNELSTSDEQHIIYLTDTLLGRLPLAVAQAGAYIGATGCSVDDYINEYDVAKKQLLQDKSLQNKRREHQPVYVTFEISINKIDHEAAKKILFHCAYLNPNNIPRDLLKVLDYSTFNDQIATLQRFSLIRAKAGLINMHCVVQDVVREKIFSNDNHWIINVIVLLNQCFQYSRNNRHVLESAKTLVPHMIRVKELALQLSNKSNFGSLLGELLYKIGVYYLDYLYDSKEAEEYLKLSLNFLVDEELIRKNKKYLLKASSKNKNYEIADNYALLYEISQEEDIDILCVLGNYYLYHPEKSDRIESAKNCFKRALKLSIKIDDKEKTAMVYHYLGTTSQHESEYKKNAVNASKSKSWATTPSGKKWIEERVKESEDLLRESLQHYKESLKIKQQYYQPNSPEIARTQHRIGVVHLIKGDWNIARDYFGLALSVLKNFYEKEPRKEIIDVLINLARSCIGASMLDKANDHLISCEVMLIELPEGMQKSSLVELKKEVETIRSAQHNAKAAFSAFVLPLSTRSQTPSLTPQFNNYAASSTNEPLLEPFAVTEETNDELSSRKRKWDQD